MIHIIKSTVQIIEQWYIVDNDIAKANSLSIIKCCMEQQKEGRMNRPSICSINSIFI